MSKKKDRNKPTGPHDQCKLCPARESNHKHCGYLVECNLPHSWYCQERQRMYDALLTKYNTLSDSYLRIRGLIGAFDTIHEPRDLVMLTETRIKELLVKVKNKA